MRAVSESMIGKPKMAPKIPIAVPILTSASERLSKAAALTAALLIFRQC